MLLRTSIAALTAAALLAGSASTARAHCQVPCGIYDDAARVKTMREDVVTITKAVAEITALAKKRDAQSANQLVRWVNTKEEHAERIIRSISDYFMAQKIKPQSGGDYLKKLAQHHQVMVAAMKCKQTASAPEVKALGKAIDAIAGYWK